METTAILLLHCPDQQGIISEVTKFITDNKGNIVYLDQYVDKVDGMFFMRIEWELEGFMIPRDKIYEYITQHIRYSFMRAYITMPMITEFAAALGFTHIRTVPSKITGGDGNRGSLAEPDFTDQFKLELKTGGKQQWQTPLRAK